MQLLKLTLFFCCWVCLFGKQDFLSYHEPVVREGHPYSMNCTNNIALDEWYITWFINNKTQLASCNKDSCVSSTKPRFEVKVENNNPIVSVLSIRNVSWEDRGLVITCNALDKNSATNIKVVWNLSRTYHLPNRSITCKQSVEQDQAIHLSCTAENVYPSISCQPVQFFNDESTNLDIVMYYNKTTSSANDKYYSITCSGVIYPYSPGEYAFCVNLTTAGQLSGYGCTSSRTITNRTMIRIIGANSAVSLCPGESKVMSVRCVIPWWLSADKPTMYCYVADEMITNISSVSLVSHKNTQNNSVESMCTFNITPNHNDKSVKCAVTAENYTLLAESAPVKIHVAHPPSKPPQFVYIGSEAHDQELIITPGLTVTVECAVDGGVSDNSAVTIECTSEFPSKPTLITQKNKAVLRFIFRSDTNCSCSVKHSSNCRMSQPSQLMFVTERTHFASYYYAWNSPWVKYVLPIATAGLFALIIGVCLGKIKWKQSNNNLFHFIRISKCRNSVKHEKSCKDSIKQVKSEVSPFLVNDIANQYDRICENNHLSDDLYPTSLSQSLTATHTFHTVSPKPQHPSMALHPRYRQEITRLDNSSFNFSTPVISDRSLKKHKYISNNDTYYKVLLSEDPAPLPPRTYLHQKCPKSEIPINNLDDISTVDTSKSNWRYQKNSDGTDRKADDCKHVGNSLSAPKRPPPPVPCRLGLGVQGCVLDGFTPASSRDTISCDTIHINDQTVEGSDMRQQLFQQIWPPLPRRVKSHKNQKPST